MRNDHPAASRRVVLAALLLAALVALAACGGAEQSAAVPTAAPTAAAPAATAAPAPTSGPTPLPSPGPDEFVNPVIDQDFPDPDLLKVGDTYYAYATNNATIRANIPAARSTDLVSWEQIGDALPVSPAWAALNFGLIWAPEVTTWDEGQSFVMYFTARDAASDKQCIGVATSAAPEGPFQPVGDGPLICQAEIGGSIDPSAFVDEDGARYVLWKNDGNCCGFDTYIYIQPVSDDGLTLQGEPTQLITNDQVWEGGLVEAPTLWKRDGKYFLFYSANSYAGVDYATGYAVADAPTGPYTKPSADPLIETDLKNGAAIGPGGQDVVIGPDGETWMVYHSWDATASYRRMMLDQLVWENGAPVLQGPDRLPQPRP